MTASVTDAGIITDTQASAFAELAARVRELYDADLVITEDSDLGKVLTIIAERDVSGQEFISTTADALDIDNATGVSLIVLGSLNGIMPLAATRSTIEMQATGAAGLDISDKRVRFEPLSTVWRMPLGTVIPAAGVVTLTAEADQTGPVNALDAGAASWTIVDGVTGWDSVASLSDALLGRTAETQEEFRARAKQAARNNGAATQPAVNEGGAATAGVTAFSADFNRGPIVNAKGTEGFHVAPIFRGGTAEDIGQTLLADLGGSTPSQGDRSVTVTDATDGELVTFKYSRFVDVRVIFRIVIGTTGAELPLDEDAAARVVNAVSGYVDTLGDGIDVSPAVAAATALASLTAGSATSATGEAARFGGTLSPAILPIAPQESAITFGDPQAAEVATTNPETYDLTVGWSIGIAIDNSSGVTATVSATSFPIVSAVTASQLASFFQLALDTDPAGGTSVVRDDVFAVIQSNTTGSTSSVEILTGSTIAFLTAIGLTLGTTTGTETDIEAVFT